jgi:phage terminase large subunit-like protein
LPVGYEKYGKDSDIEHIESKMKEESYHFDITALGGAMAKNDRIRRLIPDFEQGDIYFPKHLAYVTYEGKTVDLVKTFINEEFIPFPVAEHDDMLDALARKKDMNIPFPMEKQFVKPAFIPKLKRF